MTFHFERSKMTLHTFLPATPLAPSVVALGCFDGVHNGHASVIRTAVDIAKSHSVPCLVFTFEEPPRNLFCKDKTPLITNTKKKAELI